MNVHPRCNSLRIGRCLFRYPPSDILYHHRASVWGLRIQDSLVVTGSMDRTVVLVDPRKTEVIRHFVAHDNEWGGW